MEVLARILVVELSDLIEKFVDHYDKQSGNIARVRRGQAHAGSLPALGPLLAAQAEQALLDAAGKAGNE